MQKYSFKTSVYNEKISTNMTCTYLPELALGYNDNRLTMYN